MGYRFDNAVGESVRIMRSGMEVGAFVYKIAMANISMSSATWVSRHAALSVSWARVYIHATFEDWGQAQPGSPSAAPLLIYSLRAGIRKVHYP